MRFVLLAAAAATVTVAPVLAQNTARPKASTRTSERKVCRRAVATGSIMELRTCRTQAEWDALAARAQAEMDRNQINERSRGGVANQ